MRNPFKQSKEVREFKARERAIREKAYREEKLKLARKKGIEKARKGRGLGGLNWGEATKALGGFVEAPAGLGSVSYDFETGTLGKRKPRKRR